MYDVTRPRRDDYEVSNMILGESFIGHILDYCVCYKKAFEVPSVYDKALWERFGLPIKTSERDTIYVTPEELEAIRNKK
ncbi:MAG TPA: hypothetical protein PK765_07380 [bacterium]|nr:hypothetical protein [bacterium]